MNVDSSLGVFLCSFPVATVLFYQAILQAPSHIRNWLVALHGIAQTLPLTLSLARITGRPDSFLATFLVFGTLHTLRVLRTESWTPQTVKKQTLAERVRAVYKIWINLRCSSLHTGTWHSSYRARIRFVLHGGFLAFGVWVGEQIVSKCLWYGVQSLHVTMADLHPAKCGRVSSQMTLRDVAIGGFLSWYWIWSSYGALVLSRSLVSIFFVSVLQWDSPEDWPALFGSIREAFTLRRFWGAFWHHLHVALFASYNPLSHRGDRRVDGTRNRLHGSGIAKGLESLWIFFMAALCHAAVNLSATGHAHLGSELRFFLCNYAVCLAETAAGRLWRTVCPETKQLRWPGYCWVAVVLFWLSPGWQCALLSVPEDSQ